MKIQIEVAVYALFLYLTITFHIVFFFVWWPKCVDCRAYFNDVTLEDTELCQDDFDLKDDCDAALAILEISGFECD